MSFKIFKVEEIDNEKFLYQTPKKINFNNKKVIFIPIIYKDNLNSLPILFQIPSIKLNDSYRKDNLLLPISPINSNKTSNLKNFLNNLDEKFIEDFKLNGKKWCKELLQNLKNIEYKALVNVIDDDEKVYDNGVLSLQLEDINNTLFNKNKSNSVKVYSDRKELIDEENYKDVLQKGNIVQCILELKGLVITISENTNESNEIFPYLKTHQIRYSEEKLLDVTLENYSFLESEVEPLNNKINNSENYNANSFQEQLNNLQKPKTYDVSEEYSQTDEESEKSEEELIEEDSDKQIYKDKNGHYVLNEYSSDSTSSDSNSDSEILKKIAKGDDSSEEESPKPKPKRKYTKRNTKN